jgi:hypothetical protein
MVRWIAFEHLLYPPKINFDPETASFELEQRG